MTPEQMRDASLLELFSLEAEAQTQVLSAGLMALERNPTQADQLEACMRAAHSLKGAARGIGAGTLAGACEAAEADAARLGGVEAALDAALFDIAAYRHEQALRSLKG